MKQGFKILYKCGEESSHSVLLVRKGSYSDSWMWYIYEEATGKTIAQAKHETSVDTAEHRAQLTALKNGISPILHSKEEHAA